MTDDADQVAMAALEAEFQSRKEELLRALAYTGGTHTLDDVWEGIKEGRLQLWMGPHSVMVTEVQATPQFRVLHFFLAAGRMEELEVMYPSVMEWGKTEMQCAKASLAGRPGWARSFLNKSGWTTSHLVLTKEI
jgi:hypothetical protein